MLFDVSTPLGFRVHTNMSYWEIIVSINHPACKDVREMCRLRLGFPMKQGGAEVTQGLFCFIEPRVRIVGYALS